MVKKTHFVYIWLFLFFLSTLPRVCAEPMKNSEADYKAALKVSKEEAETLRTELVDYAKKFLGCPYRSGGIGPKSFDCSGLVYTTSKESIGIQLPRTARAIYKRMEPIEKEELESGDLVFFKTTSSGNISHVGIYVGDGKFIHSASDGTKTGVIISSMDEKFWKKTYCSSGRYLASTKNSETTK